MTFRKIDFYTTGGGAIFLTRILIFLTSKCRISRSEGSLGMEVGSVRTRIAPGFIFRCQTNFTKESFFSKDFPNFRFFVEKNMILGYYVLSFWVIERV